MTKRILLTATVIAGIHLVLSLVSAALVFGSGLEAFDNPDYQLSMVEVVAHSLIGILLQPGTSLWAPWMSKNLPNVVEWGLILLNSFFWGVALSFLLASPKQQR